MSWRLQVRHTTGYRYDDDVVSPYNDAQLTPQTRPGQFTLDARIETLPVALQHRYVDYWGTQVTAFDVQQPHSSLEVTSTSVVDTSPAPPRPEQGPGWEQLPGAGLRDRFWKTLAATPLTGCDAEMQEAARVAAAGLAPRDAALAVTDQVFRQVSYVPGATGVRTSATQAWELG